MSFSEKVYIYVQNIPLGQVRSYGEVAVAIGHPGAARAVGTALKNNSRPAVYIEGDHLISSGIMNPVNCHRVIPSNGSRHKPGSFFGRSDPIAVGLKSQLLLWEEGKL